MGLHGENHLNWMKARNAALLPHNLHFITDYAAQGQVGWFLPRLYWLIFTLCDFMFTRVTTAFVVGT